MGGSNGNGDKKLITGQNFVTINNGSNINNGGGLMTTTASSFNSSIGQKVSSIKKQSPATKY